MVDLIGRMVPRCCEVLKELPFFFTQSNNVLFNHRFNLEYNLFTIVLTRQTFPDRPLEAFSEDRLCYKDTEIEVSGSLAKIRLPDLMVLSEELAVILGDGRGTITREMPPPELIIEVASPGKSNEERDYRYKRSEYAARGVFEYWVINPTDSNISIFSLEAGFYESAVYIRQMVIQSRFEALRLTADQVLKRGRL